MRVRDLLSDASKWTQGAFHIDDAYCLAGAISHCYPLVEIHKVRRRVAEYLGCPVVDWNDDPARTFAEVRAVIEDLNL